MTPARKDKALLGFYRMNREKKKGLNREEIVWDRDK